MKLNEMFTGWYDYDKKEFDRILKEGYDLGLREVGFYTTGEPLLNKKLPLFFGEISLSWTM